jgi:hypothetical protein
MEILNKVFVFYFTSCRKIPKNYQTIYHQIIVSYYTYQAKNSGQFRPPQRCMISGFRREVDGQCALLGYYAASIVVVSYRRFGTNYQSYLQGPRIQKERRNQNSAVLPSRLSTTQHDEVKCAKKRNLVSEEIGYIIFG